MLVNTPPGDSQTQELGSGIHHGEGVSHMFIGLLLSMTTARATILLPKSPSV